MDPVFVLTAAVCVLAGLGVVSLRNPVYSAVSLLVCFLGFAVIYVKLGAPFLAAIHVIVYTGAILVLFLFVIMLLNLAPQELGREYPLWARMLMGAGCVALFALLAVPFSSLNLGTAAGAGGFGGIKEVGRSLFVHYGFPFELMSVLILVAIFGGVTLAKRKI